MFRLSIRRPAQRTIGRQAKPVREHMIMELDRLEQDPDDPTLNIEPVSGGDRLRLRFKGPARHFRAIFLRDDAAKTIEVLVVAPRGQVYDQRRLRR